MRVLLLTPIPHYLHGPITAAGDTYDVSMEVPEKWPQDIDFVVSFGYRHIISEGWINYYRGKMINIHISLLPWNRGADPNFWSWFDRTPKGVSIHAIDPGIDTGDILTQNPITVLKGGPGRTLRSTYSAMVGAAAYLFADKWPKLRSLDWDPISISTEAGSYHRVGEKDQWMSKLPLGWDTPVSEVEELGAASKGN